MFPESVQVPAVWVQFDVRAKTAPETVRVVAAALMVRALFKLRRFPETVWAVV